MCGSMSNDVIMYTLSEILLTAIENYKKIHECLEF